MNITQWCTHICGLGSTTLLELLSANIRHKSRPACTFAFFQQSAHKAQLALLSPGKLVIFLTFVYFSLVQQWQSNFYYYLKKMPKKCTKSTSVTQIFFATYQHWTRWEVSQWSVASTWTPNVTVGLRWVSYDTVPLVGIERWGRRIKSYGWYHPSKFREPYLGLFWAGWLGWWPQVTVGVGNLEEVAFVGGSRRHWFTGPATRTLTNL